MKRLSDRIGWLRLAVFVGGVAVTLFAALNNSAAALLMGVMAFGAFGGVVAYHRHINHWIARLRGWQSVKAVHAARNTLDWAHLPAPIVPDPAHFAANALAVDLDLISERSVHRLLNTAASREGGQRLLDWLTVANGLPEIAALQTRQARVRELIDQPLFFDKLTLAARTDSYAAPPGTTYTPWAVSPFTRWFSTYTAAPSLLPYLAVLGSLSAVNIVLWLLNTFGVLPDFWSLTLLVYLAVYFWAMRSVGNVFQTALDLRDGLRRFGAVFTFLERYPYKPDSQLAGLVAPFRDPTQRPSHFVGQVGRIARAVSLTHNQLLWLVINAIVPWDIFFGWQLNRCRAQLAATLPGLLEVWFELEALGALASFARLNPECAFPHLVADNTDPRQGLTLRAVGVGHPLIAPEQRISNDFELGNTTHPDGQPSDTLDQIALITGSNMAGKSTFLRTLGINMCLAYAGGVVIASEMQVSRFRLFTCIRVSDSVADGFSYFYAEVQRLRLLLTELETDESLPLFFLIDEIFRGTNSRERSIGSRAYIKALTHHAGLGLISTHDLELTALADESPSIINYHFRDAVIDGHMTFDYKLHSGPCPTTNALTIMRLAGLPVSE